MKNKILNIVLVFLAILFANICINKVYGTSYPNDFATIELPSKYENYYKNEEEDSIYTSFNYADYDSGMYNRVHYDIYERGSYYATEYTQTKLDEIVTSYQKYVTENGDSVKILYKSLIENNGCKGMRIAYKYYNTEADTSYYQDEYYFLTDNYKVELLLYSNKESFMDSTEAKNILKSFKIKDTVLKSRGIPFTDVASSSWYLGAVKYCYEKGMIKGTNDYTFSPEANLTRGMLATILWRMEGAPTPTGGTSFSDVSSSEYYYQAIKWASSKKIVSGYSGTTKFGPKDNVTREQLAVMLNNYCRYKNKYKASSTSLTTFTDGSKVSSYAKTAMQWAVGNKVITGNNNKLNPQGNATRAEVASMLYKYCMNIK